ncbi:hypothetical protein FJZ36_03735 [Candidatus Poribacteria bacterium]|nr:hypothetical protein [Candidatus Poribacteria bacterium]
MEVGDAEGLRRYVARVADIVREYIARLAQIPAPRRTTRVTLNVLARELSPQSLDRLRTLLDAADFVKFARHVPPEEAARRCLKQARELSAELSAELADELQRR